MGQTQLLMLVMAVIIIGIAVAVGITQMGESAFAANQNAVIGDSADIVARAHTWFRKPVMMGGGGQDFATNGGLSFPAIGMSTQHDENEYSNANGCYVIDNPTGDTFTLNAYGKERDRNGQVVHVIIPFNAGSPQYSPTITTIAYDDVNYCADGDDDDD